jgi:hypothetical protein
MRWRWDDPRQLVLGLLLWSLWFVAVYGGHALACRAGAPTPWIVTALLASTAIVVTVLAWAAWRCLAAVRTLPAGVARFLARSAAALHAVAALSTVFVGLPILWVPACA